MRRMLWLALVLAACDPMPPPMPGRDAGLVFDSATFGVDARIVPDAWDVADGGPPVIPQQSWTITLAVSPVAVLDVTLEARAEAGTVRAVVGGGGASRTVVFDILDGTLIARDDVEVGIVDRTLCDRTVYILQQLTLAFVDDDHDGTHETLMQVHVPTVLADDGRGDAPTGAMWAADLALDITLDVTPPTLALDPTAILPGMPLALRASEPMSPALAPQLTGARAVTLNADPGASAAATWRLDTWDLPSGHYDLGFVGVASDLVGLTATTLPTLALDMPDAVPLDALTPPLLVRSAIPLREVGSLPGEMPFGAPDPTYLARSPFVMAFDIGAHAPAQIQVVFRASSNGTATMANVDFVLFTPDGSVQTYDGASFFGTSSSVNGYTQETDPLVLLLRVPVTTRGRAYLAVFPAGSGSCGPTTPGDIAISFTRPTFMQAFGP